MCSSNPFITLKKTNSWEFPDSPGLRLRLHCRGPRFSPWLGWETVTLQAARPETKQNSCPFSSCSPLLRPSSPGALQSVDLPLLDVSYERNHTICDLFSFTILYLPSLLLSFKICVHFLNPLYIVHLLTLLVYHTARTPSSHSSQTRWPLPQPDSHLT